MLESLRTDVDALSGDLRTINGKLENIMSMLSDVASGQPQTSSSNTSSCAGPGAGGGSGFEGGNADDSAAAPDDVLHGSGVALGGWTGGDRGSDGVIDRGGHDSRVRGAPAGFFVGQFFPTSRPLLPPPPQMPSATQRYPVGPHRVREDANAARRCDDLDAIAEKWSSDIPQ